MDRQLLLQLIVPPILLFSLLFIYTQIAGPIPFSISSVNTNKSDVFTVSGEGKVTASPDIATLTAGVTASAGTVKDTQEQLNSNINRVSEAIKKLGIDSKDIQTTNYNISPTYDYRNGNQRITGYQANSNLVVKVRDLNKVNSIIDTSTESGANQVGGVNFDVADRSKYENEARQKAVAEAKKKAENASYIAGFSLGKIINYSENFGGGRPIPLMGLGASEDTVKKETQVEPGSTEITVTVTLSYELR